MNDDYCLWMGDIDPTMDEDIIKNIFQFYNVYPQAIKLIKDKKTNLNKNYCFIYFKNINEAYNTLNQLKGKPIPNTSLNFKLNWANYHISTTKTIYVGNLNPLINDTSLFNFFKSKYRSVSKAKIITDNGKSKGYGFITFKRENDYRKSLIEMDGFFFEGTKIRVKEYKKKDEDENNENDQQNLKDSNKTNNQLEIDNSIRKNSNNNVKPLNTNNLDSNNLNSNSFITILNTINELNWISNANPINDISTRINNNKNINKHNIKYNKNETGNNFIDSDKNYLNKINKNNYEESNESQNNKNKKLEVLEEFDEISLKIKINESLKKMFEYYKESYLINKNRVISKLILYLIFM